MPIQLLIYLGIFLAVAGVIGGAYHSVKKAGADEVRAELEPKLTACAGEVEKHNQAAKALAEESARKAKEASRRLAEATAKGRVWEDNALRLQAVLTNRKPTDQTCSQAWERIRGGK